MDMRALLQKVIARARRKLFARGILQVRKEDDCLKWAIVGTGYMASTWADLLLTSRIGVLHAVCSRSRGRAEAFGHRFGCEAAFDSLDAMLAGERERLDFVYVATPLHAHYAIIKRCIEAGVNVLTEKPATPKADEWLELTQLAKSRGVVLIEGMWMVCLPTLAQANAWIDAGLIGEIQWIKADIQKYQLSPDRQKEGEGGVLMDYGVYALAFAGHFLSGAPDWISSRSRAGIHGDDADWAIQAGRRGRTAVINISSNSHASSTAAVIGDCGMIEWSGPFNRTGAVTLYQFQSGEVKRKMFKYRQQGFEFQLAEATRTLKNFLLESERLPHSMTFESLEFAERARAHARDDPSSAGPSSSE